MTELFKALYNCGLILETNLEKLSIEKNKIDDFKKEKLIEEKTCNLKDKEIIYYKSTELGEKHFRVNNPNKNNFYRNFNVEKMILLSDFYCSLSEEERRNWKNKDEWLIDVQVGKPIDGTYYKGKDLLGVSILSSKSSLDVIRQIEMFVKKSKIKNLNYIFY